jgi:exopolysaccharide production protein ExoQ
MNGTRRLFDFILLGGCAFIQSGACLSMVLDAEPPLAGNPAWRSVLAISYLVVALVLLPWYRETLFVLRRNWSLVALVFFAFLSSSWAEMPDLVLRKSIGLFGTTLFGVALAVRFSFRDQLRMLSWLFRVLGVLSLASVVLLPSYGISEQGEWRGVFDHKNGMGTVMGLSLLVEWQLPASNRLSKVLKSLAMLLYAVLLLNSDSVTPAVALVVMMVLLKIYNFAALRLRIPLYAVLLITAILASVGFSLVVANSDSVMGALGRSSNLTGRTEIWSLVVSFIPQKPILGYGYSGFWLGASPESFVVNRIMRGQVMYSHNGYLEMLLTLGMIGLLLSLVLIGTAMKRSLYFSEQRQFGTALWPLAFLLYFMLHNLGECTILMQNIEWAMFVSCIAGTDPMLLSFDVEQEDEFSLVPMEELG